MVAATFVACQSKTDLDSKKDVILVDTSGMYKSNMLTDTGSVIETTTLTDRNRNRNTNTAVANTQTTNTRSTNNNHRNGTVNTSNNNTNSRQTTTVSRRRRGWSHAAKDATIGGVGGAVVGAVISKNHVKGAIIGGVLGAGGGYILGRSKDKKDGRVQ